MRHQPYGVTVAMDPGELLAGPRGRRLCLAFATGAGSQTGPASPALSAAVSMAAWDLDPGSGSSRMRLSFGVPDADPSPIPTPADVARLLGSVELDAPDDWALIRALASAVDFARYWQEPDGEDVLAATPVVRQALERVAAHLAGSLPAWWSAPLDASAQQVVTLDGTTAEPVRSAADHLAHWHERTVAGESRARAELPRDPRASVSGTWWSAPLPGLTSTTRSLGPLGPVGLWLVEDAAGWDQASVAQVSVPDDATVYEIDGPQAWAELCRRYPLDVTCSRRHDWYRTTGIDSEWVVPDWAEVSRDVDAVHLTAAGYLTTAGRAAVVDGETRSVLAGWNPDQTYWFVDLARQPATVQRWQRDDEGRWSP